MRETQTLTIELTPRQAELLWLAITSVPLREELQGAEEVEALDDLALLFFEYFQK